MLSDFTTPLASSIRSATKYLTGCFEHYDALATLQLDFLSFSQF